MPLLRGANPMLLLRSVSGRNLFESSWRPSDACLEIGLRPTPRTPSGGAPAIWDRTGRRARSFSGNRIFSACSMRPDAHGVPGNRADLCSTCQRRRNAS
jgi:hypothetical protein